jgi:hypothetical protein
LTKHGGGVQGLCDIRNILAHPVPNRIRYLAVHVGAGSDPSVFTDRPDTWKLPQSPVVDANLTAARLGWLSETLATLIRAQTTPASLQNSTAHERNASIVEELKHSRNSGFSRL